jgi:hypothetical protein
MQQQLRSSADSWQAECCSDKQHQRAKLLLLNSRALASAWRVDLVRAWFRCSTAAACLQGFSVGMVAFCNLHLLASRRWYRL